MTPERYAALDRAGRGLSREEVAAGWHYCPDWDFMLIGPGMEGELDGCTCPKETQQPFVG